MPSTGIDRLLIGPSQHLPSAPYINNPMTAYTAPQVRKIIDDLDDIFRAAAQNGRVKAVFARERKAIVSFLMKKRSVLLILG
jgi:2-keto-3-deoxy-L-rhamnonate aldolase RhmA